MEAWKHGDLSQPTSGSRAYSLRVPSAHSVSLESTNIVALPEPSELPPPHHRPI